MADKDFAQLDNTPFESDKNTPPSNAKTVLIVTLSLMFSILCFAAGFFMGEKQGLETDKGNKHETLVNTVNEQKQKLESYKKEVEKWRQKEANTSQVGELTFYNELPKQAIMPEPLDGKVVEASIPSKAESIISENQTDLALTEKRLNEIIQQELQTSSRKYRIQIASFKNKSDSQNLLNQLAIEGLDGIIRKVDLANMGTRYRVFTQTFGQRELAIRAKDRIKEKFHITGLIITE